MVADLGRIEIKNSFRPDTKLAMLGKWRETLSISFNQMNVTTQPVEFENVNNVQISLEVRTGAGVLSGLP